MTNPTPTMAKYGNVAHSHRYVEISKEENGYSVSATYRVLKKDGYRDKPYWEERRTFVFGTVSEMIAFVNEYMRADATELSED